jgi:acetyl esterase/lipase
MDNPFIVRGIFLPAFLFLLYTQGSGYVEATHEDLVYATVNGKDLKLDIYMPAGITDPALVIWVHGGAWQSGTKANVPRIFVDNGFAVASLDFRQSTEAPFPAAIYDIKAAIRFLKGNAGRYKYKASRIAIAGSSSGGHLAALVGSTNGNQTLEGNVGNYLKESSEVHAIIDYYGASNLTTILAQSTPHGLSVRKPALQLLLGAQPEDTLTLAKLASPVFHIDKKDPPLLILHGDQDPQMPINQSHELEGQYKKQNLDVQFEVVYGAAHGGDVFFSGEYATLAINFLRRTLNH